MSMVNKEISRRVFARMHLEQVDNKVIYATLCDMNPNATGDEVILFMAECIKNPSTPPARPSTRYDPNTGITYNNDVCGSSQPRSNC